MSKKRQIGQEIIEGLREALAHQRGEITLRTTDLELPDAPPQYRQADVKRIRSQLHFSQGVMARFMGVSVATVRSWEQGLKQPAATACRLMEIIQAQPRLVRETIVARKRRAG